MEVSAQSYHQPLFTLVQHHHTEWQTRVHSQFIQQHTNVSCLLQGFCKTLYLQLTPIAEVLSKGAWGQTWKDYGIDTRQMNLKQALNLYPVHVGAHIDEGMLLVLP